MLSGEGAKKNKPSQDTESGFCWIKLIDWVPLFGGRKPERHLSPTSILCTFCSYSAVWLSTVSNKSEIWTIELFICLHMQEHIHSISSCSSVSRLHYRCIERTHVFFLTSVLAVKVDLGEHGSWLFFGILADDTNLPGWRSGNWTACSWSSSVRELQLLSIQGCKLHSNGACVLLIKYPYFIVKSNPSCS